MTMMMMVMMVMINLDVLPEVSEGFCQVHHGTTVDEEDAANLREVEDDDELDLSLPPSRTPRPRAGSW